MMVTEKSQTNFLGLFIAALLVCAIALFNTVLAVPV